MYCRATILVVAGTWATALSAQTPPPRFPGVPQFTLTPQARAASAETQAALRQFLKNYSLEEAIVCSIPLLQVPVPKNLEPMPVRRPPADLIDNMPVVSPAPACREENR
ncbi:MAG TPA: hypothetical protein VMQ86_20360 [Bryobacteraceae bacterium]|jgi:hypothetical protein|nr:hypothetical protein [Bryobacteraceae bacterium]